MTTARITEPRNETQSEALNDALKEMLKLRGELKMREAEVLGLKEKLCDAISELSLWKM